MNKKNKILATVLATALLLSPLAVMANEGDWYIGVKDMNDDLQQRSITNQPSSGVFSPGVAVDHSTLSFYVWPRNSGFTFTSIPDTQNYNVTFDPSWFASNLDYTGIPGLSTTLSGKASTSSLATLQAQVNGLGGGSASSFNIATFLTTPASSTPWIASSTGNGIMASWMYAKLMAVSTTTPTMSTDSRSIVTGTGATGFQVSATRDSVIRESVKVTTTATIGTPSEGYIVLEVAPTNSATAGDWVENGRCGNGQNVTLAALLQSVQVTVCQLNADVPAGYYAKLRSITISDTPTFAFVSGVKTIK